MLSPTIANKDMNRNSTGQCQYKIFFHCFRYTIRYSFHLTSLGFWKGINFSCHSQIFHTSSHLSSYCFWSSHFSELQKASSAISLQAHTSLSPTSSFFPRFSSSIIGKSTDVCVCNPALIRSLSNSKTHYFRLSRQSDSRDERLSSSSHVSSRAGIPCSCEPSLSNTVSRVRSWFISYSPNERSNVRRWLGICSRKSPSISSPAFPAGSGRGSWPS
jgi:hypothetical protein